MTLTVVLVCGPGLGEPLTSLHITRAGARERLAELTAELLADRLGYVPARLRDAPTTTQLVDALTGIGLTTSIDDVLVRP